MRYAIGLFCFAASFAHAAEHATWDDYLKANRYKCPGPFDALKEARVVKLGGLEYEHKGYELRVKGDGDADKTARIGVLSAIKDATEATRKNLEESIAWFKAQKVDWLVANGDLALDEFALEDVVELLAQSGLPTLIVIGNSESKGGWARVYKDRIEKYPNLINGNMVRHIVADDVEFVTAPGYHDRKFVHKDSGCLYKEDDITTTERALTAAGLAPRVVVAHGPPRGRGKVALDLANDGTNVGDPLLNRLIEKLKAPYGLFGHILESGGRGVGVDMAAAVKEGAWSKQLFVNAGSASGDPWAMNGGDPSYGMAMLVTVEAERAKYEVKRFPARYLEN